MSRLSSLRGWSCAVIILVIVTVLLLPMATASKVWILAVLAFGAIFTVLEAGSKGRILAGLMIALLTLYLGASLQRAVLLFNTPGFLAKGLGVGMLVLPLVGAWAMIREIVFGSRVEKLGKQLGQEGGLPPDDLPRHPSGRFVREAADAQFHVFKDQAEAAPQDWRVWYRLGLAYSASGDTRRARGAMREAVGLYQRETPQNSPGQAR